MTQAGRRASPKPEHIRNAHRSIKGRAARPGENPAFSDTCLL